MSEDMERVHPSRWYFSFLVLEISFQTREGTNHFLHPFFLSFYKNGDEATIRMV